MSEYSPASYTRVPYLVPTMRRMVLAIRRFHEYANEMAKQNASLR